MSVALQPWTPCLPIRGGKLKSSKNFSSSNPQLPFICTSTNSYLRNNSSSSLNSSYIWREANPNNFNMYSTSVSSLNTSYRYSLGGSGVSEWRANSEERSPRQGTPNKYKYKASSNYDNLYSNSCTTPLLTRKKHSPQSKIWKNSNQSPQNNVKWQQQQQQSSQHQIQSQDYYQQKQQPPLYDRRLNRSFEAPQELTRNISKMTPLRRSTPHLPGEDLHQSIPTTRNSSTSSWCCGNFVMKQWRKVHNCE